MVQDVRQVAIVSGKKFPRQVQIVGTSFEGDAMGYCDLRPIVNFLTRLVVWVCPGGWCSTPAEQ